MERYGLCKFLFALKEGVFLISPPAFNRALGLALQGLPGGEAGAFVNEVAVQPLGKLVPIGTSGLV